MMTAGPISLDGTSAAVPASFPGGWWRDGYPMRPAAGWPDQALNFEIGKRAYGCRLIENRPPAKTQDGGETHQPALSLASSP